MQLYIDNIAEVSWTLSDGEKLSDLSDTCKFHEI